MGRRSVRGDQGFAHPAGFHLLRLTLCDGPETAAPVGHHGAGRGVEVGTGLGGHEHPGTPGAVGRDGSGPPGVRLVILSNTDRDIISHSLKQIGVPFDQVVVAEDVGAYKPAVANFERVLAEVEPALAPFSPRPHWGKLFLADAAEIAPRYERLPDFAALAERLDPRGAFRNDWLERRVLGA